MSLQENRWLSEALTRFGLSKYESQVYIALLQTGVASIKELASKTAVPRQKIYPALKKLEELGLAQFLPEKPLKCKALPPDQNSDFWNSVRALELELKQMRRALIELKKLHELGKEASEIERKDLWIIKNECNIVRKLRELLDKASEEVVLVLSEEGLNLIINNCYDKVTELSYNGVKARVLTKVSRRAISQVKRLIGLCDVRHIHLAPEGNICVVDEQEALLFKSREKWLDDHGPQLVGIYLSEQEVLEALRSAIKNEWGVSKNASSILLLLERSTLPEEVLAFDRSSYLNVALSYHLITTLNLALGKRDAYNILKVMGKKLLKEVSDHLPVPINTAPLHEGLKALSSLMLFYDGVLANISFNEVTSTLTCEFAHLLSPQYRLAAEEGLEVFPSLWGIVLLGMLDCYGLDVSSSDAIYHPDDSKWLIQYRLRRRHVELSEEEERLPLPP